MRSDCIFSAEINKIETKSPAQQMTKKNKMDFVDQI